MSADADRGSFAAWVPITGAFSIWFAHFLLIYAAALIWPDQALAKVAAAVATLLALGLLALLFRWLRSVHAGGAQTAFARRFGMGSLFIATAATVFDAVPALIG